jgi:SAM-dependent methyltransferase
LPVQTIWLDLDATLWPSEGIASIESGQQPHHLDRVPPCELFGGVSEEAWRWLHLVGRESCPFLERYLPSLTGDPRYEEGVVGTSGNEALLRGFQVYQLFKQRYAEYADPLTPESRVLDFGCGWGRVIRFFLREVAPENLIGIDANERTVRICRETNRWCRFEHCAVLPPSGLAPDSFDLIYAWSVFSHLSEEAHVRWLEEFERLLRSNGVLVLTTFQRDFLSDSSNPACSLANDPTPMEEWFGAYDRGEFCYRPMKGASHFGDAFIPEQYVRRQWSKQFTVREYFGADQLGQNIIVCTKA